MKWFKKFWPGLLIFVVVLIFFFPVFKGQIPFPGDLLINQNPYSAQSYLGFAPGAYPNKAQGPDVIYEIYPWRYFSINQLKQGDIPFWNPHNFSGNPQMADFQTAIFYPANLLYFILPFNISWALIIMLQPFLAGLFMYFFLKKGIGLKDFPSVVGGISFGFSSYMTVWMEYGNIGSTLLWLPLALLFVKYYIDKPSAKLLLGFSFILSLVILAGYIQGAFYIYVLCFFYRTFLMFCKKEEFTKHKKNFLFLISALLPLALTSFQILPTLQLFSQSTRGAYSLLQIQKNLAPIYNWLTIAIPDFFGNPATRNYWIDGTYIERVMYPGTVILFFAIYAIFTKTKFLEKRFFLIVSLFSLIIATNLPLVKYFYLIPIPLISTTIPTREFSVLIFSLIILGAIGLDKLLTENIFKNKFVFVYLGLLISVWLIVLLTARFHPSLSPNLKISLHNLVIPSVLVVLTCLSIFIKRINNKLFFILILCLVVFDLFYFFNKITPFASSSLTYPDTPIISYLKTHAGINRFWGYGSAYVASNFQSVDGTFSPEGNDPLHVSTYGQLLSSSVNGEFPKALPRPDANVAPGYGTDDLKTNQFRKRVLDLLGVKYILQKQDFVNAWEQTDLSTFPSDQYQLINKIFPWQLYENKTVLPRFFLSSDFVLAGSKVQALSLIYDKNLDLKRTLILQKTPNITIDKNSTGNVKLISYTANKIIFQTESSGNQLLFLSDNYYPEWKALIDGRKSEILIADYTFRAVAVPKGKHTLEFIYDPTSFYEGLLISFLGVLSILGYGIISLRNAKN